MAAGSWQLPAPVSGWGPPPPAPEGPASGRAVAGSAHPPAGSGFDPAEVAAQGGVTPKLRLLGWCALGQVLGGVPGHPQTLLEPAPTGRPWAGGLEPGATAVLVPATPSPSPMPGGGPREGSDQAGGPEGCDPPPCCSRPPLPRQPAGRIHPRHGHWLPPTATVPAGG